MYISPNKLQIAISIIVISALIFNETIIMENTLIFSTKTPFPYESSAFFHCGPTHIQDHTNSRS